MPSLAGFFITPCDHPCDIIVYIQKALSELLHIRPALISQIEVAEPHISQTFLLLILL